MSYFLSVLRANPELLAMGWAIIALAVGLGLLLLLMGA